MSKKSRKKQAVVAKKSQPQWVLVGGVVALALVAIVAVILLSGSEDESPTGEATLISERISPQDYQSDFLANSSDHVLIDVRTPGEFADGYIEGAINLNVETLESNLDQIPRDKPVVLYCRSGNRSAVAADILESAGFTEIYDLGGIIDWAAAGYAVVQ